MRNLWGRNRLLIALYVPFVALVLFHIMSLKHAPLLGKVLFTGTRPPLNNKVLATRAKAEIKGAHGGQVFVAAKRRTYHGSRPFSSNISTSGVSHKPYPRSAEQLTCNKWAVVTTIFGPTALVKQLVEMKDWCVVVVGDQQVRGDKDTDSAMTLLLGCHRLIILTRIYDMINLNINVTTTNPCITSQSPSTYDIQSDNLIFLGPEEQGEEARPAR